jgi:hypothetical protein
MGCKRFPGGFLENAGVRKCSFSEILAADDALTFGDCCNERLFEDAQIDLPGPFGVISQSEVICPSRQLFQTLFISVLIV